MNIKQKLLLNVNYLYQKRLKSDILVRSNGPIRLLGINRPDKNNCLNLNTIQRLRDEIEIFDKDTTSKAAVIYGEMGNFSSGVDPEELKSDPDLVDKIEKTGFFESHCSKPVVSAVAGFAVGHGFDIALWSDFVVMEDTAIFSSYSRKLNINSTKDQIERLYKLFGLRKTLDWILTGRHITAKEALEWGIASRIVACGTGLGQGVALANTLCFHSQDELKSDRDFIYSLHNNCKFK